MGFVFTFCAWTAVSAQWDRQGAEKALEKARALRQELEAAPDFSQEGYLRCIETYRLVYLKDPHYSGVDDAIFEAGQLYQLMGDKLQAPEYLAHAARQYRYLLSDYPRSPHRADASGRLEQLKTAAAAKAPENPEPRAATAGDTRKEVQSIRHWSTRDYTRVTIDLNGETRYVKTRISNPDRVFFDIKNAHVRREWFNKHFEVDDDYLKQIRVAQNRADVVRVVLDFSGATDFTVTELRDPFRIVIELRGKKPAQTAAAALATRAKGTEETQPPPRKQAPALPAAEIAAVERAVLHMPPSPESVGNVPKPAVFEPVAGSEPSDYNAVTATVSTQPPAAAPAPAPAPPARKAVKADVPEAPVVSRDPGTAARPASPTSAGVRTMTRMLGLKIGRIVIDPGHGGHDTGTIGRGGLREKDLVLEVALRLRELIEENLGAEVVLTRETDVFIPLEERTAIANTRQADLFISIHANSARNRDTSGVETYFLNFARTAAEREIAARENATAEQNIRDLSDLITKIARAEKSAESREFAAILQGALHAGMRRLTPSTRNRGVRSAPFVVLIGAHMPSVLAEVAFISNPRDEKLLKKSETRKHLAKSLFSGVEGYMRTLGSDVAQSRPNSK